MIGTGRGRIVAVIGGNDEQIVASQLRNDARQPGVEPFQVGGVSAHVVAVSVKGVEVHEIGHDQTA